MPIFFHCVPQSDEATQISAATGSIARASVAMTRRAVKFY
jgi:hypothetical protein